MGFVSRLKKHDLNEILVSKKFLNTFPFSGKRSCRSVLPAGAQYGQWKELVRHLIAWTLINNF